MVRSKSVGRLRLVPDVDTPCLSGFFQLGGEVVGLVIDDAVRSEFASSRCFLVAADGGDDRRAGRLRHLHDHRADAAGAAIDEDGLAGLQLRAVEQPEVGGDADQRARGGLFVRHSGRCGVEPLSLDADELRARALPAEKPLVRSPDAVARLEVRHARSDRVDHAREVGAGDRRLRQRHGCRAGADVGVDRVDRRGQDLDPDLAVASARESAGRRP